MRKPKSFIAAILILSILFILSPLYSFAGDHHDDDDKDEYKYKYEKKLSPEARQIIDISAYDVAQQQLNEQNAALEARRKQLEQQSAQQQQLARQLTMAEKQLNEQNEALNARANELERRRKEQEAREQQISNLEQQLFAGMQAFNVIYPENGNNEYMVKDDNQNGISDILEGFSKLAFR